MSSWTEKGNRCALNKYQIMESAGLKPGVVAVCIAVAVLVIGFLFFGSSAPRGDASAPVSGSVSAQQFAAVEGVMAKQGIRSERDPNSTDTFRFYLPAPVAKTIGSADAKRLAKTTRDKLGSGAAVYILSPTGEPLADVTPWNP